MQKIKKNKGGRPTKFNDEARRLLPIMAKAGLTDGQMAEVLGVTETTLNNWKKENGKFFESIKELKTDKDGKVIRSLFERACGYKHPEDKIFCNNGEIIVQETIKHYPPDPTSMIFWLKNRQPDNWRDKHDIEHSGTITQLAPQKIDKED